MNTLCKTISTVLIILVANVSYSMPNQVQTHAFNFMNAPSAEITPE